MKKQAGLSLIELMVAMGLGVFLILGVINVFLSNKDSSQVETSVARLQENGRIALDMLVADIRAANYIGCNSASGKVREIANGTDFTGPRGYERGTSSWTPALPTALNTAIGNTARIGSDVITVEQGRPMTATITATVLAASTAVSVSNNVECIADGDLVMLASCVTAHLFEVTNTPTCGTGATTFQFAASGNTPASINSEYDSDDDLLRYFEKTWYVRDTGRRRTALNIPVYALYRRTNGVAQEMVEGIEYMQILYGQQLNTGNIRYVPADDANLDMDEVSSVRIGLLLQSFEPILEVVDTNVYQVLDQAIDSTGTTFTHNGDLTLRRVFRTTAIFRN